MAFLLVCPGSFLACFSCRPGGERWDAIDPVRRPGQVLRAAPVRATGRQHPAGNTGLARQDRPSRQGMGNRQECERKTVAPSCCWRWLGFLIGRGRNRVRCLQVAPRRRLPLAVPDAPPAVSVAVSALDPGGSAPVDRHRNPVVCTAATVTWCWPGCSATTCEGIVLVGQQPDCARESRQGFGHQRVGAGVQTGVIDAGRQFHDRAAGITSSGGITT